ncbi:MAG: c-type cytochrome [Halioglobus sp.]
MRSLTRYFVLTSFALASGLTLAASDRLEDGRKAYVASCATCHETGTDGAPSVHQAEDWKNRSQLWDAVLFTHAEKGYLTMPAKGGDNSISTYDVDVAAEYMLTISHPDMAHD